METIASKYHELQSMYVRAESFMLKPEGVPSLKQILPNLDACFNELIKLCESLSDTTVIPGSNNLCKADTIKTELNFDDHAIKWLVKIESEQCQQSGISGSRYSSRKSTSSVSTTSSVRSEKQKSMVKLKIAKAAKKQEERRVYETRLKSKQRAEELKRAAVKKFREG